MGKDRTAMMQLIDLICAYNRISNSDKLSMEFLIHMAEELLETEKQQILEARMQDMDSGLDPRTYIDLANEYYNETYENYFD